jgi:O-antigen/teichoic acid export membrane protein
MRTCLLNLKAEQKGPRARAWDCSAVFMLTRAQAASRQSGAIGTVMWSFAKGLVLTPGWLKSPIVRRLASGGFWSLAGDAGSRVLSFASAIIVARLLGVAEFGAFALIQSTLVMLMTFAAFGMGHTSTRFIAAYRDTAPERLEKIAGTTLLFAIISGLLAAVGLFVMAPWIAERMLRAPELVGSLQLIAPVLVIYSVSGAMMGTILGFEAFQAIAALAWFSGSVSFIAVVAGAYVSGLKGAIIGLMVGEIVRCLCIARLTRKTMSLNGLKFFGPLNMSEASMLWQFSVPMLLGSALNAPVMWACQAMIARQTSGMVEIGYYDAAQKWMTVVVLLPMAASAGLAPVLANLGSKFGAVRVKRTTTVLALVQVGLTLVPSALVALFSAQAIAIFGASFAAAAPVVGILMALAPIFVLKHLYWQALTANGDAWSALWSSVLWAVVAVGLTWSWQDAGAIGLAKAMLVAYGVALVPNIVLVERAGRQ